MYGYIYLTTNNINGKKYIGQHKASRFSESYKGSGKLLQAAFKKYGKDNFSTEILQECNNVEDLNSAERYFISLYNAVQDEHYYNILPGGQSTAEVDSRRRDNLVQHGDRTLGSKWMHKDNTYVRVTGDAISSFLEQGYVYGAPRRSELAKLRYREARKDLQVMTDGFRTIYVRPFEVEDYKALGYREGRDPSLVGDQMHGWIYVTNDLEERRITPDLLDEYISRGYRRGRKTFKTFNRTRPAHNKGKKAVRVNGKTHYVEE